MPKKNANPTRASAKSKAVAKAPKRTSPRARKTRERVKSQIEFIDTLPEWHTEFEAERIARAQELRTQYFAARSALQRRREELMSYPEVTGVHVGFRRKNGRVHFPLEYCIRVSVFNKRASAKDGRITRTIEPKFGVPVDVEEREFEMIGEAQSSRRIGIPMRGAQTQPFSNVVFDPLRGGIVIAQESTPDNWGTLGMIFRSDKGKLALTCEHVASTSENVTQPSAFGPNDNVRTIGTVIASERNEMMDVAWIKIGAGIASSVKTIVNARGGFLDASFEFGSAIENAIAFKIGAASSPDEVVRGRVQSTSATVDIRNGGPMHNQIIIEQLDGTASKPIIEPGDSGSIVLQTTPRHNVFRIIGLAHASTANQNAIVACSWSSIVSTFPELGL